MTDSRTVKLLLAAILVVTLVVAGLLVANLSSGGKDKWSSKQCIKASLAGSGYTRADMEDHGCFD